MKYPAIKSQGETSALGLGGVVASMCPNRGGNNISIYNLCPNVIVINGFYGYLCGKNIFVHNCILIIKSDS